MSISDYAELKLLDAVFNATAFNVAADPFVSLHDGDPGEDGSNEIVAGGNTYVRKQAAFGAAAAGAVDNDAQIQWTDMPDCEAAGTNEQLGYVGVWDSLIGGSNNFLWGGALTVAKNVNAGDTFTIAAADLDVTLN